MKYLKARLTVSIINQVHILLYLASVFYLFYAFGSEIPDQWWIYPVFLGGYLFWQFPYELLAGYLLPKRHGRYLGSAGKWLLGWLRAVAVMLIFWMLHGLMLVILGDWGGQLAVAGWVFLWMLLLAGFRQYLARLIAPFKIRYESNRGRMVFYFNTEDRGFTGGISGMPGQESIIMPAYWQKKWEPEIFDLQLSRRHGSLNTGSHGAGLFSSLFLQTGLFFLASFLVGSPGSWTWLIMTLCLFSILSSVATLGLIPWLNRRGSFQMDRWVYYKKVDGDIINQAIEKSRHLQDDPGFRLAKVWRASPTLEERKSFRQSGEDVKGTWHMASVWQYYGLFGGNLLFRSLPSNLGLPSRWVYPPVE